MSHSLMRMKSFLHTEFYSSAQVCTDFPLDLNDPSAEEIVVRFRQVQGELFDRLRRARSCVVQFQQSSYPHQCPPTRNSQELLFFDSAVKFTCCRIYHHSSKASTINDQKCGFWSKCNLSMSSLSRCR